MTTVAEFASSGEAGEEPSSASPVRTVLFADPFLAASADEFVCRLLEHRSIELLAVYCQGPGAGAPARLRDLWHRRGPLGLVIALQEAVTGFARIALRPEKHRRRRQALSGIRVVKDLHASEILEQVAGLDADLGLIYGGPILKPELFRIPRLGTLGIHHGKLPEYRGKKTTFWEMYNRERTAGVTIQRIDAGLDTGEVIAATSVPIGRKSYSRVWRDVQAAGVGLFIRAILLVTATEVAEPSGEERLPEPAGAAGPLYRDPTPRQLLGLWLRRLDGRRPKAGELE